MGLRRLLRRPPGNQTRVAGAEAQRHAPVPTVPAGKNDGSQPRRFFAIFEKKKRAVSVKTVRAAGLPPRSDRLDLRSAEGVARGKYGRLAKVPGSDFR